MLHEHCCQCLRLVGSLSLAGLLYIATGTSVAAQSVTLSGIMGERALLVIDKAAPQVFAAGDTRLGVKLISASGETAVIDLHGKRHTLHLRESVVGASADHGPASGSRVVLHAGSGGHFFGTAQINGATAQFVVDTGASNVAIGAALADQLGLPYRSGQPQVVATANGMVQAYRVSLTSIRIGDVDIYNVEATVVPGGLPIVLLGNSYLSRFQMKRENELLVLEKRY